MNELLINFIENAVIVIVVVGFVSILLKGFLWKYLRVRGSFGRLVLVKKRSVHRDSFEIGRIEDNTLVFKGAGDDGRVCVKDQTVFYKAMGVTWVDFDEATGALSKTNYDGITGYDPEKYESLVQRALYKPSILANREKLILIGIGLLIIAVAISIYLGYMNGVHIDALTAKVGTIKAPTPTVQAVAGV